MYCIKCGTEITTKYCMKCGTVNTALYSNGAGKKNTLPEYKRIPAEAKNASKIHKDFVIKDHYPIAIAFILILVNIIFIILYATIRNVIIF